MPADGALTGSTCTGHEAFFRLDSPVPRGHVFQVVVESRQASNELGVVVESVGTSERNWSQSPFEGGRQVIGVVSDGGAYSVHVQVVGATVDEMPSVHFYTLSVVDTAPATNTCCSTSTGPGCADAVTLSCLCQSDNDCCSRPYDALCVSEAMALCGLRCEGEAAPSDCCSVSAAPGCLEDEVEACVCGIDPYCCVGFFDDNCVRLAENQCGTACPKAHTDAP